MRVKKCLLAVLAGSCIMASSSYAGEWKLEHGQWRYEDNGSYFGNGWHWIDGKCYYFDVNGCCLLNTVTPDGYTVNESGAWTIDGVVQVQYTESGAENVTNAGENSKRSEEAYSIPLNDVFPSDLAQVVSWHSESTGYYMIPMMSDGEPTIYFSVENDTINTFLAYGVMIDSVEQNENGGVVCRGRMYPYTKSFGTGEGEVNGIVEVTWNSLESMDFPSVRMIDGHQMTDVSMIADDYCYYGLTE